MVSSWTLRSLSSTTKRYLHVHVWASCNPLETIWTQSRTCENESYGQLSWEEDKFWLISPASFQDCSDVLVIQKMNMKLISPVKLVKFCLPLMTTVNSFHSHRIGSLYCLVGSYNKIILLGWGACPDPVSNNISSYPEPVDMAIHFQSHNNIIIYKIIYFLSFRVLLDFYWRKFPCFKK